MLHRHSSSSCDSYTMRRHVHCLRATCQRAMKCQLLLQEENRRCIPPIAFMFPREACVAQEQKNL